MGIISSVKSFFSGKKTDQVRASFDLTRTNHENERHWKDTDALSGRAAYFKSERKLARERSRLEAANNSWYAGMLRTSVNHFVGTGPRIQVLTDNPELNNRIETAWRKWSEEIGLVDKLGVMVETYLRDGECFMMRATQPKLHPITLDIRLYEPDQVAQPYWHVLDPTIEDGIRVDNLGNQIEFWIYDHHPGDLNIGHVNLLKGQWYPADDVIQLARFDRPGQLRGFPRYAPAIDWLAHMRRFSKATLSAAEAAALWGVFVKTTGSQVMPAASPSDFAAVEWERSAMNFLPDGWEPTQLRADHPATTNEMFQRTELMYFCRCGNMPYSLASGTSKDSNFASAKMDIKNTWEPEVKGEQARLTRTVMRPIVRWFLVECVFVPGLLDDAPSINEIAYQVFWPPVPQSDEGDVADAAEKRLSMGQSTPSREYAMQGLNYDTEMEAAARDYGVTVDELKKRLFEKLLGEKTPTAPSAGGDGASTPVPVNKRVGANGIRDLIGSPN